MKKEIAEREIRKNKSKKMKQETSKTNLREKRGITLVALVITVIIIIILATVAISFAFGDNGLINRAEDARDMYANDTAYTEGSIANVESYINGILDGSGIGGGGSDTPTIPTEWNQSKVTPVLSDDNKYVPVPIGYTASEATGEGSVISGFVIYEETGAVNDTNVADAKKERNQFVWIPVDDINEIAWTAQEGGVDNNGRTNYQGKLYDFDASGATEKTSYGQGTTSYREPDIVEYYDNNTTYVTDILGLADGEALKTQLQEEFNAMVESVDTYGGFYIGRYETGNLASTVGTEPVSVKDNDANSNVNWYYMYQNSKLVKANDNVESTMIWGSLWDRTLIWLAETNAESSGQYGKSYQEIDDSSTWGNYRNYSGEIAVEGYGERQATGFSEAWKANNIYDLARKCLRLDD